MNSANWQPAEYDAPRRRLVPCYDAFYGAVVELISRTGSPQPRVLDLGAGTGLLSAEVVKRVSVGSLTLLDRSAEMLAVAADRLAAQAPTLRPAEMTAALPEGPFDVVMSALAIHHLSHEEKRNLFDRVHAVLEPGGLFVNAEQVSAPDEPRQQLLEATHWDAARALGSDDAEIAAAVERMRIDRCAPADAQVGWLRESGFAGAGVVFQWFRFAVYAGWKDRGSSEADVTIT